MHAIDFVEHLAEVAEERQHHPDIDIRYNKVTLRLSTPRRRRRHACATCELAEAIERLALTAARGPAARARRPREPAAGRRARIRNRALVAQGIRARASGARGRRFESFRGHQRCQDDNVLPAQVTGFWCPVAYPIATDRFRLASPSGAAGVATEL